MMNHSCFFVFVLSTTALLGTAAQQCKVDTLISEGFQYHYNVCNVEEFNKSNGVDRPMRYEAYKDFGSYASVPNQKTVTCPSSEQEDISLHDTSYSTGMNTVWIVENTSDEPVVVAFVHKDGKEISAKNHVYPAHDDNDSILQPKEWMAVYTYEGHVFHVRSLTEDGTQGDLLLQHRVGLIPVGQQLASQLVCNRDDPDPRAGDGEKTNEGPYVREKPEVMRPCNAIDVGFRNMAGCPLHGYYVLSDHQHGIVNDDPRTQDDFSSCSEIFRFHLGVEQAGLTDFMWQWSSSTKFEGTYMGHTFAFRLASDPTVLVDRVTLSPTFVPSCPNRKKDTASMTGSEGVRENVSISNHHKKKNAPKKENTALVGKKLRRQRQLADVRVASALRKKTSAQVEEMNSMLCSQNNCSQVFKSGNTTGVNAGKTILTGVIQSY